MAAPGVQMPGNAGVAHMPSTVGGASRGAISMPYGAHVPANMSYGAHGPSGTTPHPAVGTEGMPTRAAPARTAGISRSPGSHLPAAGVSSQHAAYALHRGGTPGANRPVAANALVRPGGPLVSAHGGGTIHPASAVQHAALRPAGLPSDPRVGGAARLHTVGLPAAGTLAHHEPSPFLHANPQRDVVHDRSFVAAHAHDFHTRSVREFSAHEFAVWRGGRWSNEWHYGRRGWWWDVDGVWYPYANPIFPYPLEVAALVAYDQPVVDGPNLEAEESVPPGQEPGAMASGNAAGGSGTPPGILPLPPAPQGRYRCADPGGFYPDVGACAAPWELVQDAPPAAQP